jgi:CheY-like chemotaxis protein
MKRVLIVDDDPDIRDALAAILSEDYKVLTSSGRREAISIFSNSEIPDIILLDVRMESHQEGFEFIEELSQMEKHRKIPIILVTSTEAMTVSGAVAEIARKTREKYNEQDMNILVLRTVSGEVLVDYKSKMSGEEVTVQVDGYHPKPINPERLKKEIEFVLGKYAQ